MKDLLFEKACGEARKTETQLHGTPCEYGTCGHNVEDGPEIEVINQIVEHCMVNFVRKIRIERTNQ